MNAILRILAQPGSVDALLRYCYRQRRRDDAVTRAEVAALEMWAEAGILIGDASIDAEVFKSRKKPGKRAAHHVVISAKSDEPGIEKKLLRAARQFCRRYARGRSYVIVIHKSDRPECHPHCHIILESYGELGTALRFSRADVREMAAMSFTREFEAVRSDGSVSPNRGASPVYPHARHLVAREVALRLLNGETWDSLIAKKEISPARVKHGKIMSFVYREQRLRVATVERLLVIERQRRMEKSVDALMATSSRVTSRSLTGMFDDLAEAVTADDVSAKSKGFSR